MPPKRQEYTWADLEGQIASEILYAPRTHGDPHNQGEWPTVHCRIIIYLKHTVIGSLWSNHLALVAAVLVARQRDVNSVINTLTGLHCRFKELFSELQLGTVGQWDADNHMRAYLSGEVRPEDSQRKRTRFWKDYHTATKLLEAWKASLPNVEQSRYESFMLPSANPLSLQGLVKREEVEQQQRQLRKTETDAVVPQFSALRIEAHLRYNQLLRLRGAYQQALKKVQENPSHLPLSFFYDEGEPPRERLSFRIWDRKSFILSHMYSQPVIRQAELGIGTCSNERNSLFLEFVKSERLTGDAPTEGLWFTEILRQGLLGSKLDSGSEEDQKRKQEWLMAWGYGGEDDPRKSAPFHAETPGLLTWSLADAQFMYAAQQKAQGILIPVDALYAAGMFGLLIVDLITTTGMRSNEAMQVRLSNDCFVRLVMNAPPGAKDQSPRVRFAFRLIPKGERTDTPQDYFIGEETKRLLVKVARMLAEKYDLQSGEPLPCVLFDPNHGRSHRFGSAPYLFQYNRKHLSDGAITACMRFLLHGMIFQTREGKLVILKPHLLRHSFATHAVQVEKIPIDIVGEWLKQKSLDVTEYYSQPTESMVAEAVDRYLARIAVSIHVGKAVQRSTQELQQLYEQAKGKAGTLADVIGGQCVSHGFCAAKFACVGCPGKVPDPAKRLQLEKHKIWAVQQVTYATSEGLLPEAERMRQLARDCETELQEIEAIEAYRKDEEQSVCISIEARE